jgi:hypothetical protein
MGIDCLHALHREQAKTRHRQKHERNDRNDLAADREFGHQGIPEGFAANSFADPRDSYTSSSLTAVNTAVRINT